MKISVVIPSYNQAPYLEAAIRSVIEQDHADAEVIVMDGGSTDGSVSIIERYASRLTYWVSAPDGGQTHALKEGFWRATGDIIGWLNSDDILSPGALERVARAAANLGSSDAVFYGGFEIIDENGHVEEVYFGTPVARWIAQVIGPVVSQQGAFFGRAAYHRVGGMDTSLQYAMDFDLWLKFFQAGYPFVLVPAVQGQFRRHSLQKGHSIEWLRRCDTEELALQRKYGLAPRGSARHTVARYAHAALAMTRGQMYRTIARRFARRGRLREFASTYSP